MNCNECVLLITGCISPNVEVPVLKLTDSTERRKQYIESILYYIEKSPFDKIIYCDNSNAEAEPLVFEAAKSRKKQVEWLSFSGDSEKTVECGKGYGEGEIVDYVLCNSRLITEADTIIKVTGRLIVKNISSLLRNMKAEKLYFWPMAISEQRLIVDTRLYAMPITWYKTYFRQTYLQVDDRKEMYLERIFGLTIYQNKMSFKCFLTVPNFSGMSGSMGHRYDSWLFTRIRLTVTMYKNLIRWHLMKKDSAQLRR